jgi:hypothetical protein
LAFGFGGGGGQNGVALSDLENGLQGRHARITNSEQSIPVCVAKNHKTTKNESPLHIWGGMGGGFTIMQVASSEPGSSFKIANCSPNSDHSPWQSPDATHPNFSTWRHNPCIDPTGNAKDLSAHSEQTWKSPESPMAQIEPEAPLMCKFRRQTWSTLCPTTRAPSRIATRK